MLNTTIRSSSSPSPLKLPGAADAADVVSPVKIPEEAEEALKAKLSSLLGKRQAAEDDVLPVARAKQRRVRPAKSKVRQPIEPRAAGADGALGGSRRSRASGRFRGRTAGRRLRSRRGPSLWARRTSACSSMRSRGAGARRSSG